MARRNRYISRKVGKEAGPIWIKSIFSVFAKHLFYGQYATRQAKDSMMGTFAEIIPPISFGERISFHGLGMVPILIEEIPEIPRINILDNALKNGTVRITETSEAGEVPFLFIKNTGEQPVIILDGEEVLGGKQNRIINTSLIIMPHTSVNIPVSCVEAGRWGGQKNDDFSSGKSIFPARSRAVQKQTVTASIIDNSGFKSDQQAVWKEVSCCLRGIEVQSPTSNFQEGREHVGQKIETFVTAIRPVAKQIGAIFIDHQSVLGLEILATPFLFAASSGKIIRSFAFEVLKTPDVTECSFDRVTQWCDKAFLSPFTKHESPASGADIRVSTRDLIGSGLIWNDTLVHFSCFPCVPFVANKNRRRDALRSLLEAP